MSRIGVLINVGSSTKYPNGRGRVFQDLSFEYLPIPEVERTREKSPTYRELGFHNVKYPDLPVHLDPEFDTFTFGYFNRGFGSTETLLNLKKKDYLFFYATLDKEKGWAPFLIAYFKIYSVVDCRKSSHKEIFQLESKGFKQNAHLKRKNPSVDLLIRGSKNSRLLAKAFPLAEDFNHLRLKKSLRRLIFTIGGKKIQRNTPWYRWTLVTSNSNTLIRMIKEVTNHKVQN